MIACSFSRLVTVLVLSLWLSSAGTAQADALRIGAEDDWYPYTALREGQIVGMSADIVRAAFAASGTAIDLTPYPYSRCMELTRTGKLPACFNTTPDPDIRAAYLLPQQALFTGSIMLWGRAGAEPVGDLSELVGKRVAVTIGYTYGEQFDNYPGIQRIPVRRDINGFLMLQRGRVDYVIAFNGTTRALMQERPSLVGQFAPVATVHRPQLFLTFSRRHPDAPALMQRFDEGMQRITQDGTYMQILGKWQLADGQSDGQGSTLHEHHNDKTESP
ncbi:substrate-binding periplasmic protein [Pseudomonas sp. SH1-B]